MKTYRIPELAEHYTKHDMIQSHAELPPLSSPRLRILHAALEQDGAIKGRSELYTLATSLVQLGMDTHDLIDVDTRKQRESKMRTRQLNVLAGDYFSARFYHLLAAAGQIDMIARLSQAVCEVNRIKVNLYTRMRGLKINADEYYGYAVELKSEMFQHFANLLNGQSARLWPELLGGVARCEVAIEEIGRSENPDRFEQGWAYWHLLQVGNEEERHQLATGKTDHGHFMELVQKYDVTSLLAAKFRQAADAVSSVAARLESGGLAGELNSIVDHFASKLGAWPALNETR